MESKKTELLIEKLKKGDEAAFREIYDNYRNYIYFICIKICNSQQDAQEVLQDTFLYAYKHVKEIKNPSAFSSWIKAIAIRKCYRKNNHARIDNIRDDREEITTLEEENVDFLPESFLNRKDLRETLMKIIDELPDKQRKTVYLYYYADLKTDEIAKLNKCSPNTVYANLRKARESLKQKINEMQKGNKNIVLYSNLLPLYLLFKTDMDMFEMSKAVSELCYHNILNKMVMPVISAKGILGLATTGLVGTALIFSDSWQHQLQKLPTSEQAETTTISAEPIDLPEMTSSPASTQKPLLIIEDIAETSEQSTIATTVDSEEPQFPQQPSAVVTEQTESPVLTSPEGADQEPIPTLTTTSEVTPVPIPNALMDLDSVVTEEEIVQESTTAPEEEIIQGTTSASVIVEAEPFDFSEVLKKLESHRSLEDILDIIAQYDFEQTIKLTDGRAVTYSLYELKRDNKKILVGIFVNAETDDWTVRYSFVEADFPEILSMDLLDWITEE